LYVADVALGRSPLLAQICTSLLVPVNFSHADHDVSVEPGKNVCREWIPSELQPTSARHVNARKSLSGGELLGPVSRSRGWGKYKRKFPAHPRVTQLKTPQEQTGLWD
jgi:hypothetical protein